MKNQIIFLLAIVGLTMINSCKKDDPQPTADFSFTGSGCTAPCAVLFENKSTDATEYSWDFGDSTTSTETNPTKTYNVGGTYTVTLTATGKGGTASTSKQVLIQNSVQSQLPTASFTINNNGCVEPCAVSFVNTSANADSYSWNFGDGGTSTEQNPSHTYTTNGNYTVTLIATNAAGSNQSQQIVTIGDNPCGGVTCLNGGTCVSGVCNCPTGYTGANCGTEMTPTTVTITKIVLNSYPPTDNGSGWDLDGGPDIFLSINQGTSANDVKFSAVANNQTGSSISFQTNFPTTLQFPSTNYAIGVWDEDVTSADDLMGGYYFIPNDYHSGFPSTIHLGGADIDMTLYVSWNF